MIKINGVASNNCKIIDHGKYAEITITINTNESIRIYFDLLNSSGNAYLIKNDSISKPITFDLSVSFNLDDYQDRLTANCIIGGYKIDIINECIVELNQTANA